MRRGADEDACVFIQRFFMSKAIFMIEKHILDGFIRRMKKVD